MFRRVEFFVFYLIIFVKFSNETRLIDEWWKDVVLYQIYPRSFKDSNGDGIGDLNGITEKADHFKDIGIGAVWLSPIYKSPQIDFGYDISDYEQLEPVYGTMEDFKTLRNKLHSLGIRLVLDFVPNHTSDQHNWFEKSKKKLEPYTDYYVWIEPKTFENGEPVPPNNWVRSCGAAAENSNNFRISITEGSMWEYVEERKQFYLHQFDKKQPDLNYRNKAVVEEMKNVLRFWLDLGVDGFRVDAPACLFEDVYLRDEPQITNDSVISGYLAHSSLYHIYTQNLPEDYELIEDFRTILDEYANKDEISRLMVTESASSLEFNLKFYGTQEHPGASMPFNTYLMSDLNRSSNAIEYVKAIRKWIDFIPEDKWHNWMIGNHDQFRVPTRYSPQLIDAMNMLVMLLGGTPVTYYGEEIGMEDTYIRWDQTKDVLGLHAGPKMYQTVSRDPERSPYQWDATENAGFSNTSGKTWLPVNPNFWRLNLAEQKIQNRSHYTIYKRLTALRMNEIFRKGQMETYILSDWVFAFTRGLEQNSEIYVVVVNVGSENEKIHLKDVVKNLEDQIYVHTASINSEYDNGDILNTSGDGFNMRSKSSLLLTTNREFSKNINSATPPASTAPILALLLSFFINLFVLT